MIGIASVAGNPDNACAVKGKGSATQFLKYVAYSKLSYDWNYSFDNTTTFRRLSPWLDPAHTSAMTIDAVKSDCTPATSGTGITGINSNLGDKILLYPNPSQNGIVTANFNLDQTSDVYVSVYSITGSLLKSYKISQVKNNTYTFDLSQLADGMYVLSFNNGIQSTVKKLTITK